MQEFNYHCHTSFMNIFDGSSTAEEMISAYEQKGLKEIGISNHCICHPTIAKMPFMHKQNFSDIDKLIDIYKQSFDYIDEAASKHTIKVRKGLEVDFFPSKEWRNNFERIIKALKPDYLIGATHFIRSADESFMCGIYFLNNLPVLSREEMDELLRNYWLNIEQAIKSGYFSFIAHPDYCCQFNLCTTPEWDGYKYNVIEALSQHNTACEVNTGGLRRIGRPFPDWWMVEKMIKQNIPLIISDDAHRTIDVCSHFSETEDMLSKLGCVNRFFLNK